MDRRLKESTLELKMLSSEEFDKRVRPERKLPSHLLPDVTGTPILTDQSCLPPTRLKSRTYIGGSGMSMHVHLSCRQVRHSISGTTSAKLIESKQTQLASRRSFNVTHRKPQTSFGSYRATITRPLLTTSILTCCTTAISPLCCLITARRRIHDGADTCTL